MNILILTKTSIPEIGRTIPDWNSLSHNYRVTDQVDSLEQPPDVIISMGVGVMGQTYKAVGLYPKARLYCYNWDCYEWVWSSPRPGEYDYNRYGRLLLKATEVWVPTVCTQRRTQQWWNIPSVVIPSSAPYWDYPTTKGDYVLCTLREIPDKYWGDFEAACITAELPYQMLNHELPYAAYQQAVANCRFLVSHLYEASTGGLSLLEGYYLGKPVLIRDSEYNGANEYFAGRQYRYSHARYLPGWLRYIWEHSVVEPDHREWVVRNHSSSLMVSRMEERINAYQG